MLLREGNYSWTVWGENTHANSASSRDHTHAGSEKNMHLELHRGPLQPYNSLEAWHCGLQEDMGAIPPAIQELQNTEHGESQVPH